MATEEQVEAVVLNAASGNFAADNIANELQAIQEKLDALVNDGTSIWTAIFSILTFFALAGALIGLKKTILVQIEKLTKKTDTKVDDLLIDIIISFTKPLYAIPVSLYIATFIFPICAPINNLAEFLFLGSLVFFAISVVQKFILLLVDQLDSSKSQQEKANFNRNVSKATSFVFYSLGIIFVFDNLGFNMSTLVAGFGIGGMAIALAAQAVLGDAVASFSLFFDKPFEVDQPVTILGHSGIVKSIGFKTTHLSAWTGEEVVIPNSAVSGSVIQNYSGNRTNSLVSVSIAADTPTEKVDSLPTVLLRALEGHESEFEPLEAYFREFGPFCFVFEVRFQVKSSAPPAVRAATGKVNNTILHALLKEGINSPLPRQVFISEKPAF